MKFLTVTDVRALARKYGVRPSRALGQNFMIDPNTIRRLIRLAEISPEEQVVEVGAGFGTLTLALSEAAERVIAIELDRSLFAALSEVASGLANVEPVRGDAMKADYAALTAGAPFRLVSNLPYNIATPLICELLKTAPNCTDFVAVVQKEAGERFAAAPGSKAYGAVSVLAAYYTDARVLGRVPPTVFWPQPKVESVAVRMTRRAPPVDVQAQSLMKVVRAAFSQRRKTLRNSLAASLQVEVSNMQHLLEAAGVDPGARPETLFLPDFASIARELGARGILTDR